MRVTSLKTLGIVVLMATTLVRCGGDSPLDPTPVCSFSLAPGDSGFGSDGGTGSVTVTVAAGCTWTATKSGDWIAVTSGGTGNGNGTVTYSVSPNPDTQPRSGGLSIGGRNHAVTQAARSPVVCTYELSSDTAAVGNEGGPQTFGVKAPSECAWSATSDVAWMTITSGQTSTGDGTVSYSVTPNNDVATRVGTITVANRKFTVTQSGELAACQYSVSAVQFSPCMPAGTLIATLTTEASCPWTATADSSWINLPGGTSGRGSTTITMTYSENYDAPRHGIVMVRWPTPTAGQNIHVSQAGCTYAVSRGAFSFVSTGGSGTFDVFQQSVPNTCGGATQDQCVWTAQSNVPWITVTSSMPRRGDNPVAFTVAVNDSAVPRTGTIIVRDKVVTITQTGR